MVCKAIFHPEYVISGVYRKAIQMLQHYQSTREMVEKNRPEESVYCFRPDVLIENAHLFTRLFKGRVLYAVKANPLDPVMDALYAGGIRHFDTASLPEISSVCERYEDSHSYFMHPVKAWKAMGVAYHRYGVRHFVVDHSDELHKVMDVLGDVDEPPIVMVRLATPSKEATFNLSEKFGATPDQTVTLLRAAADMGARPGLCFHVGSQCVSTSGYEAAFNLTGDVLSQTNEPIHCLDVGGGFPVTYENTVPSPPPLEDYMSVIDAGIEALNLPADCHLMCEPGRALTADGMSVVTQVQLRKGDTLYLNDGVYGTFGGSRLGLTFPKRVIRPEQEVSGDPTSFKVFGPTCDSLDVLPYPLDLPCDIRTGDWIEFGMMGAYGPAIRTDFNGFMPTKFCTIDEPFVS